LSQKILSYRYQKRYYHIVHIFIIRSSLRIVTLLVITKRICGRGRIRNPEAGSEREKLKPLDRPPGADKMWFDGILHNFHILGEAVKKLPDDLRQKRTDIPWSRIAGMRDFITHVYFALDLDILRQGIQEDVLLLLQRVQQMITSAEENRAP
jgi:uncharacterized protein with HEPN domain